MDNQHIARLEAHLEQLVEGAFASLFGKKIRAQDIALQLARVMEDGVQPAQGSDPRLIAPDQYLIYAHPSVQTHLLERNATLPQSLADHLVELATLIGYRLINTPTIKFLADSQLDTGKLIINASYRNSPEHSTAALQHVVLPGLSKPHSPQLVLDGRLINLEQDVINIGRNRENQIVLDDNTVSRHHIQLRLRASAYMLFDINSQGGTFVNGVQIKEHQLKSGDLIRIGKTQMLYLEENSLSDSQDNPTQAFEPDF